MPYYQYTAADKDGKMRQGTIFGMDKADLVGQLSSQGLFLVSFTLKEPAPAPAAAVPEFDTDDGEGTRRMSLVQKVLIVVVVGVGIAIGLRVYHQPHSKGAASEVNAKMALISQAKDPTRAYVESVLGPPWSFDPLSRRARYWVSSDMGAEVPYTFDGHVDRKHGIRIFRKAGKPASHH